MNCIICGYDQVEEQYYDNKTTGVPTHSICLCCGFESGYDDGYNVEDQPKFQKKYRICWLENGYKWFSTDTKPSIWNYETLATQLKNIGVDINDYM